MGKTIKKSSDGLVDLLKRHGIEPTHNSYIDIQLAKQFMPKGYNEEAKQRELVSQKKNSAKKDDRK